MKNYFITHDTHQYLFMIVIKLNLILKCSVLILIFSHVVHIHNKKLKKKKYTFKNFELNFFLKKFPRSIQKTLPSHFFFFFFFFFFF